MFVIEMNSSSILTGCNPSKTEDCIVMQLLCMLSSVVSYSLSQFLSVWFSHMKKHLPTKVQSWSHSRPASFWKIHNYPWDLILKLLLDEFYRVE